MSGPEHYIEAERLLRAASRGQDEHGLIDRRQAMDEAQVHALLALVAALGGGQ